MKYQFETTKEKADEGLNLLQDNGGRFDGSNFSIKGVEGYVKYSDGLLRITITDKLWLASWGMIEEKLNEFFE